MVPLSASIRVHYHHRPGDVARFVDYVQPIATFMPGILHGDAVSPDSGRAKKTYFVQAARRESIERGRA